MSVDQVNFRRVLMITSRQIPKEATSGRERTMSFILRALSADSYPTIYRLKSVFEKNSVGRALPIFVKGARGLLSGNFIPLQTLIFFDPKAIPEIFELIDKEKPSTIYFDGVRSAIYVPIVRRRYPDLRIICDFDDLMSHRYKALYHSRQPISIGYLKRLVPAWFQTHVINGIFARGFMLYEGRALEKFEDRLIDQVDAVVLVSDVEGKMLRQRAVSGAEVVVIPPYAAAFDGKLQTTSIRRFIFIGSDSLLQNRLTIEYLVRLWKELHPRVSLHIFGKQEGDYPAVDNVVFEGFIDRLDQAYSDGSVLLAPSFVRGGVKTKVLEAMSFGVIPVGNVTTFEGIDADCSGLSLSDAQLRDLIEAPQEAVDYLRHTGIKVISSAMETHSESRLANAWRRVIWTN